MDALKPFLEQCCLIGSTFQVTKKALRSAYELWCRETSQEPVAVRHFSRLLDDSFPEDRTADARFRRGLMLRGEWQGMLEQSERRG